MDFNLYLITDRTLFTAQCPLYLAIEDRPGGRGKGCPVAGKRSFDESIVGYGILDERIDQ